LKLWVTIMTKTAEMGQEKDKVKGLDHEKEKRKEKGNYINSKTTFLRHDALEIF